MMVHFFTRQCRSLVLFALMAFSFPLFAQTDTHVYSKMFREHHSDTQGLSYIARECHFVLDTLWNWEGFSFDRIFVAVLSIGVGLFVYVIIKFIITRLCSPLFCKFADPISARAFCDKLVPGLSWIVALLPFYIGFRPILSPGGVEVLGIYWRFFVSLEVVIFAISLYRLVKIITRFLRDKAVIANNSASEVYLVIFSTIIRILIVCVALLYVTERLGFNITALLAGAGVIGLALAFAAQDTVANVFGSIMVACDQPFKKGDYVKIDTVEGTVEYIGFRSTRLRNNDGHLIAIPNKSCANALITNISARPFVRLDMDIGLIYQTSPEDMKRALVLLEEIVRNTRAQSPEMPPHAVFTRFDSSAINIHLAAWYYSFDAKGAPAPIDYWSYVAWVSSLNLEILKRFNDEKFEFAYPTNVTYFAPLDPQNSIRIQQQ